MILLGVVLFTMTIPTQASLRESIITVKYWRDYMSSLFCEWNIFKQRSSDPEGYRAVNTGEMTDSTDNDDCHDKIEITDDTKAD